MRNKIKILAGLIVLFFGFYVMYLGSEKDSTILIIAGILIAVIGSIVIYIFRHRHNIKPIYNYRKAIEDLKKDPDNQELIDLAYKHGREFYLTRSGGAILTSKEKKVLEMDIAYARGKKID